MLQWLALQTQLKTSESEVIPVAHREPDYHLSMTFRASRILYFLTFLALLSLQSAALMAQQAQQAQQDRIAGLVDRRQTVALSGNLHPDAISQFDVGPVDPSLKLDHMTLMLKRSSAQQAALDRLLAGQQNPSSPDYHAWLTPEQFADRFGLSQNDIAKVADWLRSEGLAVDAISRARNWIWFSGTANQIQGALQTSLRRYNVGGEMHFANASEPSVPAVLAPFVLGVVGLDDFRPKSKQPKINPLAGDAAKGSLRPQFSTPSGTNYLAPGDFATIYNVNPLYNLGYDGSGQRIAVIGQSAVDLADMQLFRILYGLPKHDPQLVLVPGSPDPGQTSDMQEAALDIEWAGAVARNANITYVYSMDSLLSLIYAVDQNVAPIVSYSFGICEQSESEFLILSIRSLAQEANAQGITWVASSGDSGAAGCDPHDDPTKAQALHGLKVGFPASLPEVTAVGGTQFDEGTGQYWNTSNSSTLASALSYIPEKGWNESDAQGLAASGGGLSQVFPKPAWQIAPGVPDANSRAIPDVALSAGIHDGYLVVAGGQPVVVSGTSAAAPAFAGIVALVNHYQVLNGVSTQYGQGNINPNLYSIARNTAGVFHDITSGTNVVPCVTSTLNCPGGTLGYSAGAGYDLVTGLGSVNAFNLAVSLTKQWSTPIISGLDPNSVVVGGAGFTLAVSGTGFDAGSVVQWMGTPMPTKFVSGTQLLATIGSVQIVQQGAVAITVLTTHGVTAPTALVVGPSYGAQISDQRLTKTLASNCVQPPSVTSFSTADKVYLYYLGRVTLNNILSYDWVAPNGASVEAGDWPGGVGIFCFPTVFFQMSSTDFNPIGTWQARLFDHGSLLFALPFTVSAPNLQTISMAHAADGSGFKTTVLLTNAGTDAAPYTLRFNDDHGNIPATRFELETGSLSGLIPAGGSVTIRTAGLGPQVVGGWAELTAPPSVTGSVIYSQKTGLPSIQEGTSTILASGSQHFFLPFDNTAGAITGVAVTDPGASAATNISVTLRYSDGTSETVAYPQLAGRTHQAFAIASQFPNTANRSGVAEFTSNVALSVVAFRFNSTGAFTAFDATLAGGASTSVTRPLAHAADGSGFKTTVLLTNAGTAAAAYTLRFNDDQGNIPSSRFELEAGSLTGTIPAGGSVIIRTAGLGTQVVGGWAELTAPASVGGSVIYSQKTGLPSIQEGTATIVAAGSKHFFVPFDNTAGAVTGVAITDPGASAANNITVTLRYSDGTSEVVFYPQLPSRNHQAFAIASQFPHTGNRSGVAEFSSEVPLSVVAFRFNSTGAFTSFGVVAP